MSKRPSFQFYPADWRDDAELQSCSIGARGLWHELICLMHACTPYGELRVNGKAMDPEKAARLTGVGRREYDKLLAELGDAGVPRFTDDGVMYSKRMVEDERLRMARAEGGQMGAEHGVKGADHGSKGGRPRNETGDKKPPLPTTLNPPPSSSSPSSASSSQKEAQTPSPPSTENKNLKNGSHNAENGTGNGAHSVTIEDPNDRMARFQAKIAKHLGPDGWTIVYAATQSSSPEHKRSLAVCQQAARALGKGWPKAWPVT